MRVVQETAETNSPSPKPDASFATRSDYAECRRLHRKFGKTYYFASQSFPGVIRRRVHALYGFVRVPDEWVDNPGPKTPTQCAELLRAYRNELIHGQDGVRPSEPVLRAFCDVMRETQMSLEEPLLFLEAMEQDLVQDRYATYVDLEKYMRGSAAAVGIMMCRVLGTPQCDKVHEAACSLGNAMQLTNFLRDVGEDARRGRIYLPQEDLARFNVHESEVLVGLMSSRFKSLMEFEIDRARSLYQKADEGIPLLPGQGQLAVRLARVLYSKILDQIEANKFDVFRIRARTSGLDKALTLVRILATSPK
jgi:15-cis-phytoene synthase